jgi:hypothetical protein
MGENLWKKIEPMEGMPYFMQPTDEALYARDYISHGNWQSSDANNLIQNLKKDVSKKGTREWPHKVRAIQRFGFELSEIFHLNSHYAVAAIPTSRRPDDPLYDSRLDDAIKELVRLRPLVSIHAPAGFRESHTPQHVLGERMRPDAIYEKLEWYGFDGPAPAVLCLIDDLITCGSHFKAMQRLITEHHRNTSVFGVFWAKTYWPAQPAAAE